MINKSEKEIMSNWIGSSDHPEVSIRCLAFNHEKYIEKTLDSFLMQETNFPFEVIVHDDASTDNTVNIIKKYEEKYPNIIRPIYEKENQFSKNDGSIRKIVTKYVRGKYSALCEGDDYWTDKNKLQLQYDELESNPNCMLCVHNTRIYDLSKKKDVHLFSAQQEKKILEAREVLIGWNVHTSSFVFRSSLYEKLINFPNINKFWFGDYVLLCLALYYGDVVYLPQVMSIYNKNNVQGVTYIKDHSGKNNLVEKEMIKKFFLEEYNRYTSNKYIEITQDVIHYYELISAYHQGDCKKIFENNNYYTILCTLPFSMRARIYLKRYFPNLFDLVKRIKNTH